MTTALLIGMYVYMQRWDQWLTYSQTTNKYIGGWEVLTSTLYRVVAIQGQYVKVERISRYANDVQVKWYNSRIFTAVTAEQMPSAMDQLRRLMEYQMRSVKDDAEYVKANAQREAEKKAFDLSANTVTRAYVHASDNGYCIETVKALVSAGHKVPTIRLVVKAMVTIPIELDGNRDYTAVRELFGQTRGNIPALAGQKRSDDALIARINDELESTNCSLQYSYYDSDSMPEVTEAEVEYGTPTIRPLADVQADKPVYAGYDD